jgi:hypothetical protein
MYYHFGFSQQELFLDITNKLHSMIGVAGFQEDMNPFGLLPRGYWGNFPWVKAERA